MISLPLCQLSISVLMIKERNTKPKEIFLLTLDKNRTPLVIWMYVGVTTCETQF